MNILTNKLSKNLVNIISEYNIVNKLEQYKKVIRIINKKFYWKLQQEEEYEFELLLEKTKKSLEKSRKKIDDMSIKLDNISIDLNIVSDKVNNIGNRIDILSDKIDIHDKKCKQFLNEKTELIKNLHNLI